MALPTYQWSDPQTFTVASSIPALSLNRSDLSATVTFTQTAAAVVSCSGQLTATQFNGSGAGLTGIPGITGWFSGLTGAAAGGSKTATYAARSISLTSGDSPANGVVGKAAFSATLNLANAAGAGSVDTGTVAASSLYYVYAISNGSGTWNVVASLSTTAAGVAAGVLASYPYIKYIGFVLTDGSSNILGFTQNNTDFSFKIPYSMTTGAYGTYSNTTPSWYAFTVGGTIIPAGSTGKFGLVNYGGYMTLMAPNANYGGPMGGSPPCFGENAQTGSWLGGLYAIEFPLEATTVQIVGSGPNCYTYCLGCRLNL